MGAEAIFSNVPVLGVGLGFREPFRGDIFLHRDEISFLEITADHYLDAPPEKERELELLAEHFTLVPHALNLSLGSADGVDRNYLKKLARLVRRLDPPWWSEHVAFTRAGGIDIGHLSPTTFSAEAVEVFARNVATVRELIDAPLILENITYALSVPGGHWDEAEFLDEVLARTGCGLLLDITNLHINSINHKYDWHAFLQKLPLERIVQLHFVGGHRHDGFLIDSHSHPTPPEVWQVMDEVLRRAPVKGAVLERDENLPPFDEILLELARARAIGRLHGRWA
ncbi:MAG: DUF692 domain-containing protein [Acidobacteria bacterium]|nr:DUF692 domain-containing protein [Acidobacteriota bacterium]